jgi:2,3-bisphosphoglycerate-dependent phosphoglycerate mutase
MRHLAAAVLMVVVSAASAAAQPLVFLVRHAERADAGMAAAKVAGADPDLSGAGISRANSLAAMLKDARIRTVITTEYKRTKQTGDPVATAAGVPLTTIDSKDVAGLLKKISSSTGNVLVVGHSHTLPEVLKGLGVTEPVTIGEDEFDSLFVVTRGSPPTFVRLHYR